MSIHSSSRGSKHRNHRSQVRQTTSNCLPSQCIEDEGLTNSSQETGPASLTFSETQHRVGSYRGNDHPSHNHEPLNAQTSIASNGADFEDSLQTSISPSNAGDSYNNSLHSSSHRPVPEHQFSQYVPVCLYVFQQDTFPRNWCLQMISNPYPFH